MIAGHKLSMPTKNGRLSALDGAELNAQGADGADPARQPGNCFDSNIKVCMTVKGGRASSDQVDLMPP